MMSLLRRHIGRHRDVSPCFACANNTDIAKVDTKLRCNGSERKAACAFGSDLPHLGSSEFTPSAFCGCFLNVDGVSSDSQVLVVNATAVGDVTFGVEHITVVANLKSNGNWAVHEFPCETVRLAGTCAVPNVAVTIRTQGGGPQPAAKRATGLVHLRPEPVSYRNGQLGVPIGKVVALKKTLTFGFDLVATAARTEFHSSILLHNGGM